MAVSYGVRSFAYGELSQKFNGRVDLPYYQQGCKTLQNAFGTAIGPAEKRPGTIYEASGKTAAHKVVLIPWIISPNEGRICEFGEGYIRFYDENGRIESPPGTPVEATGSPPWQEADLYDIRFCQIGSVMYIVHPLYAPRTLTRSSDTAWAIATPSFTAGSGEENFASSSHYPSHVEMYEDRLVFARTVLKPATFWGSRVASYLDFSLRRSASVTTPVASPGIVTWTNHGLIANSTVVFSGGTLPTGITANVTYYVLGSTITPNTFQISATAGGAAINFTGVDTPPHTGYASPSLATDAWEKTPRAKANAEILWLLAEDALLFGSSEGSFRVGGKENLLSPDVAWWPTRQSNVGCSNVQALMVDDFACFVGKSGKHIYRFQYLDTVDKYVAEDLMMLCEHLPSEGVIATAHQREPDTILWAVTSDGILLSGCYSRITNTIGWSNHDLDGLVESVAVIPTDDEDQVWISIARDIGGTTVRHIEHFSGRTWGTVEDYHGVDGGVVWVGKAEKDVQAITNTNPAVCNCTGHGFVNDEKVRFRDVTNITAVNGAVYTVKLAATDYFTLYTEDGSTAIDFSGEPSAGLGGYVEQVTNVVTGLTHLEGRVVKTLGDGSVIADETVASGQVTLDEYANLIRTGLGFTSIVEPMDIAEARNRLKRITKVFAQFYRTADAQVSDGVHAAKQITFEGEPIMDEAPEGRTEGIKKLFDGFADYEGTVRIESTNPLPQTVLAITYEVVVGT